MHDFDARSPRRRQVLQRYEAPNREKRVSAFCDYLLETAGTLGKQWFNRQELNDRFRGFELTVDGDTAELIAKELIARLMHKYANPIFLHLVIAQFIDSFHGFDTFTKYKTPNVRELRRMITRYLVNNFLQQLSHDPIQRMALAVIGTEVYIDFADSRTGEFDLQKLRTALKDLLTVLEGT